MRRFVAWLIDWLRDLTRIIECRRCGATLSTATPTCVECGSDEIATYEIH